MSLSRTVQREVDFRSTDKHSLSLYKQLQQHLHRLHVATFAIIADGRYGLYSFAGHVPSDVRFEKVKCRFSSTIIRWWNYWFTASIKKIADASILAHFLFQNHKFPNEFSEGVDIRRAAVGEGTEHSLEKTSKIQGKQLIKREKRLLNKRILPTEPSPKKQTWHIKMQTQAMFHVP